LSRVIITQYSYLWFVECIYNRKKNVFCRRWKTFSLRITAHKSTVLYFRLPFVVDLIRARLLQLFDQLRMRPGDDRLQLLQLTQQVAVRILQTLDFAPVVVVLRHQQLHFALELVHVFFLFPPALLRRDLRQRVCCYL
jgi:hypothetical protein